MNRYNLEHHLVEAYSHFPMADERPVIGITTNHEGIDATLREAYYQQITRAGGIPVLLPPVEDKAVVAGTLDQIDALLLTGGADINPLWQGEQPSQGLGRVNAVRDLPELLLTRLAHNRQLPILGICRGIQTLAIALGGKVCQDISQSQKQNNSSSLREGERGWVAIKHSQDAAREEATHTVSIAPDSILFDLYGTEQLAVNSFHHQAVETTGSAFRTTATAPDGVIEAMESTECHAEMGVQWHPEWLGEAGQPLFQWLVDEANLFRRAKKLHDRVLTLDSHCDTPMFFSEDIQFHQRDKRILVDLHKMTEGRLDATTMVAYLPQPKAGEQFVDCVPFEVSGPKQYADLIFNKVEQIIEANSQHLALARTPDELYRNKQQGRKSIVLGIENGLALEGSLDNVDYFARRGVSYITLCHNGDNDICDSARGTQTHGGVSSFGADVIEEMNRCGVMVDLSHAAESSFYDALDISRYPIVCSHSNCRSLCNHPRNLTDDQLKALAQKGGVAQITLYGGFLAEQGEASIYDAMEHLEHAIRLMGIEHVGLGTDFDGDGGVRGLRDASELINFTRQLLLRRFSEADIRLIWGENWLRVMRQVQGSAV